VLAPRLAARARATGARRRSSGLVPVAPEIRPLRQTSLQANPAHRCRRRSDKERSARWSSAGAEAAPCQHRLAPLCSCCSRTQLSLFVLLPLTTAHSALLPRSHLHCQACTRHRPNALSRTHAAAAGEPREHALARARPAPTRRAGELAVMHPRARRSRARHTFLLGKAPRGAAAPTGPLLPVSVLCLSIAGGVRVQGRNPECCDCSIVHTRCSLRTGLRATVPSGPCRPADWPWPLPPLKYRTAPTPTPRRPPSYRLYLIPTTHPPPPRPTPRLAPPRHCLPAWST
jgi:hypothetical protein